MNEVPLYRVFPVVEGVELDGACRDPLEPRDGPRALPVLRREVHELLVLLFGSRVFNITFHNWMWACT